MDHPHIPDYELLATLASGPLTRIFAARHRAGGFACVVKTLQPESATNVNAIQAIAREARIGLAVRHRHVVKMLDAQIYRPPYYLVMEKLAGETLSERLDRGPLPWNHSLRLAGQVAEAVATIHGVGFVHADLRPENVIVKANDEAALTGLSRAHRPGEVSAQDGAPELALSFASDWCAFGTTLTELLTGDSAHHAERTHDILRFRPKPALASWLERQSIVWPARLTDLVERLTAIQPQDRPNSAFIINELQQLATLDTDQRQAA